MSINEVLYSICLIVRLRRSISLIYLGSMGELMLMAHLSQRGLCGSGRILVDYIRALTRPVLALAIRVLRTVLMIIIAANMSSVDVLKMRILIIFPKGIDDTVDDILRMIGSMVEPAILIMVWLSVDR